MTPVEIEIGFESDDEVAAYNALPESQKGSVAAAKNFLVKLRAKQRPPDPEIKSAPTGQVEAPRGDVARSNNVTPLAPVQAKPVPGIADKCVAVLATKYLVGFPKPDPGAASYMTLVEAFEGSHETDAHFAQYSVPGLPLRINQDALDLPAFALEMRFLSVDVDAPGHKATDKWRLAERAKIARLYASLPPAYYFETKGGYRLLWLLPPGFTLESREHVAHWRAFYLSCLRYLARVFDIHGDEACSDPTRVFRLPRVVRAGERQNHLTSPAVNPTGIWSATLAPEDIVRVEAMHEAVTSAADLPDAPADVVERTRAQLAQLAPSIAGANGHNRALEAACDCVRAGLSNSQALELMHEYNERSEPLWSEAELQHKVESAREKAGADGVLAVALRDVSARFTPKPLNFEGCAQHPFDGLTGDDIFADSEPIDLVIPDLDIGVGRPTGFVGLGNSKKTVAAMQMALDVSQGRPVWGRFPVNRARKVLYLDYESGPITREKMRRMAKHRKLKGADLRGKLEVCIEPHTYLDSAGASEELERKIRDGGFELCIVDSLCQCNPFVDENTAQASEPLKLMKHISVRTGCAFVVLHHARKPQDGAKAGDQNMIRGHSSIFNTMGSVLLFRAGEDKNGPSIVRHDRAYNTGRTIEDFALEVKDTWNGESEQGLEVSCKDLGIVKDQEAAAAEGAKLRRNRQHFDKIKTDIMAELTKAPNGAIAGVNVLCATLTRKKEDLSGALEELAAEGRIIWPTVRRGQNRPIVIRPPDGSNLVSTLNQLSGGLS